MKLTQFDKIEAELEGVEANAFGFEMNAKMYSIMVDKLYTNKPGAVLRELSCNALDSHVEAGCPGLPFEIHMPSWLDKTFSIRDFGTGIPHDQFEDIYTNVGRSTKEGSNDQIGAYGLGSKTPFTMTDTYIVENWHSGMKTTWMCFKSKGFPSVSCASREDSSEPAGLKVSFSFDADECEQFETQLVKQLSFFAVKPVVTGISDIRWPIIPDYIGKEYFYYKEMNQTFGGSKLSVVMGNVNYSFSSSDIYGLYSRGEHEGVFRHPLCIIAPLGAVDVPPSREALEMTEKTKDYIRNVVERIKKDYIVEYNKGLLACKTSVDCYIYIADANKELLDFKKDDVFKYNNGKSADTYLKFLFGRNMKIGSHSLYIARQRINGFTFGAQKYSEGISIGHLKDGANIYVDDLGTGGRAHVEYKRQYFTSLTDKSNCYVVRPGSSMKRDVLGPECKVCMAEIVRMGLNPKLLSDVIGFPVKTKRKSGGSSAPRLQADQVYYSSKCSPGAYGNTKLSIYMGSTYTDTKLPKTGYYIEIKGNSVSVKEPAWILELFCSVSKFMDVPVYFIRTKTVEAGLPKGLKPVSSLKDEMCKSLKNSLDRDTYYCEFGQGTGLGGISCLEKLPDLIKEDKECRALIRLHKKILSKQLSDTSEISRYLRQLGETYVPLSQTVDNALLSKVNLLIEDVRRKYENQLDLIACFSGYRSYANSENKACALLNSIIKDNAVNTGI